MGVDLCRLQRRMTQDFLHHAQIGAALKEVRRRRVPQAVRGEPAVAGHEIGFLDDAAYLPLVDATTP